MRAACCMLLLFVGALIATPARAAPQAMRRIAVLVGANAPPAGRQPLHYAHDDARELAAVLKSVGGFAASDVHLLLDPTPKELLTALDAVAQVAGPDVMFLFYYSGHSDGKVLYPHGEEIPLADVRARVEQLSARIRVGILDTCRGGSWTRSKGLTVGPPLDMADLLNVETEGTALVSSSSGFEDAHEATAVHGSFFTHYFVAGLRGAADRAHDGNVTLQEAYDYARERTVKESARLTQSPQHPSFEIGLRGRQDIVLTVLTQKTSALSLTAARASMEVIQLPSGVTVADAPPGQPVRIALPPGRYLVRSVIGSRVYTKEIEVKDGDTAVLAEGQLEAVGGEPIAMKGPPPLNAPLSAWSPLGDYRWLLTLRLGVGGDPGTPANVGQGTSGTETTSSFGVHYSLLYRISDRLTWSVPWPAFSYRFGDPGGVEVMPFIGFTASGWSSTSGFSLGFTADIAARIWTTRSQRINLRAGVVMPAYGTSSSLGFAIGDQFNPFANIGYSWTIRNIVTLGADVGIDRSYWAGDGIFASSAWQYQAEWLRLGADVQVRVAPRLGLNMRVGWSTELQGGNSSYPGFLVGATVAF